MKSRMNIFQAAADGAKGMLAVEAAIEKSGLEHGLLELVRLCDRLEARPAVQAALKAEDLI